VRPSPFYWLQRILLLLAVFVCCEFGIAQAQDFGPPGDAGLTPDLEGRPEPVWRFSAGAGPGVTPDYEGSDDYKFVPVFAARAQRQEIFVALTGTTAIANVLPDPVFRLGPLLRVRASRDDVENDAVDSLGNVDTAVELGAFAGFEVDGWEGEVEIAQDVADAHGGFLVGLQLAHTWDVLPALPITAKTFTTWASHDYMQSYFGIDAAGSMRSGLDTFGAESGFKNVGLNVGARHTLASNWILSGIISYARLLGDAADSPVTADVGSANQWFGTLIVTYVF
jgi:outer membrane protein